MKREELIKKAESGEGLTVEEIVEYEKLVKPTKQVYGKYGTIAKDYLENHNRGKLLSLAGELPEYLHGIDRQAEELYNIMYSQLSQKEEYKMTDDYLSNAKKITTMQSIIEEAILNQLVYETI